MPGGVGGEEPRGSPLSAQRRDLALRRATPDNLHTQDRADGLPARRIHARRTGVQQIPDMSQPIK